MDSRANMINIPSHVKDPNYRYQMPKIIATTQGSGGNVKTKFENIKEVAHALTVPSDYPLKFIGKELGTQTEIKNDVHLINGSHSPEKLQQLLDKFIEKYVLCPKCKLPEIRIFIKKGEIRSKCRACGTISKLDDKHKFSNHIKNFPPKYDEEPEKGPVVDEKETKQKGTAGSASQPTKMVIDKETKMKIKSSTEKISKLMEKPEDVQESAKKIETILNENKFDMVIKYFVLINGIFDKKGRPVIDKKTKEPKTIPDPQWILFEKCMRGDASDNVFSAYPGVRTKGTKNSVGLLEAYADITKRGFAWNNLMLQRWTDHNGQEHRVLDDYQRNRTLIDLRAQPEEIKSKINDTIQEGCTALNRPMVGAHFLKFCGKYDMNRLSDQSTGFADLLSASYPGK